jgi:hypothetical protein
MTRWLPQSGGTGRERAETQQVLASLFAQPWAGFRQLPSDGDCSSRRVAFSMASELLLYEHSCRVADSIRLGGRRWLARMHAHAAQTAGQTASASIIEPTAKSLVRW